MSETIRQIVIKSKIEFEAPVLPQISADEFSASAKAIAEEAKANFEDVISESVSESVKRAGDALDEAGASIKEVASDTEELQKSSEEAADSVEQLAKATAELEEAEIDLNDAKTELIDNNIKSAEAFKKVGDGAFTTARGMVLLFASSEESAQEMLQAVAAVQGAFDLFKGSTDVVVGLVEGMRALRGATAASSAVATAANTVQAASTQKLAIAEGQAAVAGGAQATANVGIATTAGVASTAMTALNIAMGPIGIAIAAIGAVVVGIIALFSAWSDEEEELSEETKAATRAIVDQRKAVIDLERAVNDANENAFERRIELMKRMGASEGEINKARNDRNKENIEEFNKQARMWQDFKKRVEAQSAEGNVGTRRRNNILLAQREAEVHRLQGELIDENLARVNEQVDTNKRLYEEKRKELELEKETLQTLKDQVAEEKNRLQSIDDRIGMLGEEELAELDKINEKIKEGVKLNKEEIEFAESKLGRENVDEATRASRDAINARAGGRARFAALGGDDFNQGEEANQAQEAIKAAEEKVRELGSIDDRLKEIGEKEDELLGRMNKSVGAMIDFLEKNAKDIKRAEQRLEQLQANQ